MHFSEYDLNLLPIKNETMKSPLLLTLLFLTILLSCTKDPIESTDLQVPSTFVYDHLTTDVRYFNINNTTLSLSEITESPFFGDDTSSLNDFKALIGEMQGQNPETSNPNAFINSVEFLDGNKINLNIIVIQDSDTLDFSTECIYNKINERIYSTESCSINELGQFTFYYENSILSFYSQVILMRKTGTGFQITSMEANLSSTEDWNAALQTYIENNPPGQSNANIAIAHIKRNYRKI